MKKNLDLVNLTKTASISSIAEEPSHENHLTSNMHCTNSTL